MEKIQNKQQIMFEIRKRKKDVIFWAVSLAIILIILIFICEKENSLYFVLSSMAQTLSFVIIMLRVTQYQSCSGISINYLICFIIMILSRLITNIFSSYDIQIDIVNSIFLYLSQFISLLICFYLLYLIYLVYPETSDKMLDNKIPFYYLLIPSLILAILFKPYIFRNWFFDLMFIYSIILESVAIYPQIILFSIKKGEIETYTSNFIAFQGLSTIFVLIFWYKNYFSLNDNDSLLLGGYSGYVVIGSEILQLIIVGYYFYLYFKSIMKRKKRKKYDI
jgi:hypothetical protein